MKFIVYITTFLSICFTSCKKEIELEVMHLEPVIVVNSIINPDSLFKANISKSLGIMDTDVISYLTDAEVYISNKNNDILDQLHYQGNGDYISNTFKPQAGESYNLKVINNGLKDVTAVQKIPIPVEILDVKTSGISYVHMNGTWNDLYIDVEFIDPEGDNYYIFSVINPSENNKKSGYSFDKSFFELKREVNSSIVEKVTDNSALGLYYNNDKDYGDIGDLIFSDMLIKNKKVKIKVRESFSYDFRDEPDTVEQAAVLYSISKDYYTHLKSLARYSALDVYLTERTPVYVNINNGLGLFGCYSSHSKPFKYGWASVSNEKGTVSFNFDDHNYFLNAYKGYGTLMYALSDSLFVQCTFHYSNGTDNFRFSFSKKYKKSSALGSDKNTEIQLARQIMELKDYNYVTFDLNEEGIKAHYYKAGTDYNGLYMSYTNPWGYSSWDSLPVISQENSFFKIINKETQKDGTIICDCEFSCTLKNLDDQTITLKQGKIKFVL